MPVYTVRSGDTLGSIADNFGTSMEAIVGANPYISPDVIYPGMMLCVPESPYAPVQPTQVYLVEAGDTLSDIAQRFGSSLEEIVEFNGIEDPDLIFPERALCLPGAPMVMPVYQVQAGDTLTTIAEHFASSVGAIVDINGVEGPNDVVEGRILLIPIRGI